MQNPLRFLGFVAGMVGILGLFVHTVPKPLLGIAAPIRNEEIVRYCKEASVIIPGNDIGVTSTIQVPDSGVISDLNVVLNLDHQNVGDLEIYLSNGTITRTILSRPRNGDGECSGNNLRYNVADDEATESFSAACMDDNSKDLGDPAYTSNAAYIAGEPPSDSILAAYDKQNINGSWTLNIRDSAFPFVGIFDRWCLDFTLEGPAPEPTPTAPPVPTVPPIPTLTPVPPVPSPTPFPPSDYSVYQPLVIEGQLSTCQSVENESTNPNNSAPQALRSLPLCLVNPFIGYHDLETDREDIYLLEIEDNGDATIPLTILLDVPDINLSLYLYDQNANILAESVTSGSADERIVYLVESGRYLIRVYRDASSTTVQPYQLTVTLGK